MTHRRTFTAEFKAQVVLDLLSGAHSAAELCRQHQLTLQVLALWKTEFLERAPLVFEQDQRRSAEQERIAELERLVGRLTMELDIAKKVSGVLSSPLEQKLAVIAMLAQDYPVSVVCEIVECARSSYYHRPQPSQDAGLQYAIQEVAVTYPRYGYRRVTHQLRREGWAVNPKRVARMMHDLGLQAQRKPKPRTTTTDSRHAFPHYPNLVEHLEIVRPEQVWVSVITSIRLRQEFLYLAVLMDVFTRCIRGWHLGRSLDQRLTLRALEQALLQHTPEIHHSDQGVQYAATAYTARLQETGTQISMAAVGAAWQNGYAERLMRTLQEEEVDLSVYQDYADAMRHLGRFLDEVYLHKRIHSSLGYLTPAEFESRWRREHLAPPEMN